MVFVILLNIIYVTDFTESIESDIIHGCGHVERYTCGAFRGHRHLFHKITCRLRCEGLVPMELPVRLHRWPGTRWWPLGSSFALHKQSNGQCRRCFRCAPPPREMIDILLLLLLLLVIVRTAITCEGVQALNLKYTTNINYYNIYRLNIVAWEKL